MLLAEKNTPSPRRRKAPAISARLPVEEAQGVPERQDTHNLFILHKKKKNNTKKEGGRREKFSAARAGADGMQEELEFDKV